MSTSSPINHPPPTTDNDQQQVMPAEPALTKVVTLPQLETMEIKDEHGVVCAPKGGVACPFPWRLHECLEAADREGMEHIVSWAPHGRAFTVHKPDVFVDHVMPRFFGQTKFPSFQRQLNIYGFSRFTEGRDKGAYYHLCFVRGQRSLVRNMIRRKIKGNKHSLREKKVQHNFYDPAWENHKSDTVPQALQHQTESNNNCKAAPMETHRVSIDSQSDLMTNLPRVSETLFASQRTSSTAAPSPTTTATKKRPSIVIERFGSDNNLPLFEDTVPCAPLLVKATSNDFSRIADACASVISKEDAWESASMTEDEVDKACRATAARFVAPKAPWKKSPLVTLPVVPSTITIPDPTPVVPKPSSVPTMISFPSAFDDLAGVCACPGESDYVELETSPVNELGAIATSRDWFHRQQRFSLSMPISDPFVDPF